MSLEQHWSTLEDLDGRHISFASELEGLDPDILAGWAIDGYLEDIVKEKIVVLGYPLKSGSVKCSPMKRIINDRIQLAKENLQCQDIVPFVQPVGNGENNWFFGYLQVPELLNNETGSDTTLLQEAQRAWEKSKWQLHKSLIATYVAKTGDTSVIPKFFNRIY